MLKIPSTRYPLLVFGAIGVVAIVSATTIALYNRYIFANAKPVSYYIDLATKPQYATDEEYAVAEDESLLSEGTQFASSSLCRDYSLSENFESNTLNPSLYTLGRTLITNGSLSLLKQADLVQSNRTVLLNRAPGLYFAPILAGQFEMGLSVLDFSTPRQLASQYFKDRQLPTMSGIRVRFASQDRQEGNLLFTLYTKPSGKYFAELSRFKPETGETKLLERKELLGMTANKAAQLSFVRKEDPEGHLFLIAKVSYTDSEERAITLEPRRLDGDVVSLAVKHRANWQLSETQAHVDALTLKGCIVSRSVIESRNLEERTEAGENILENVLGD